MNITIPVNGHHPAPVPVQKAPPAKQELLSIKEVTALLGFSDRTIERWVKLGIFPKPVRFNGSVRWRREDVERVAREGTHDAGR